MEHEPTGSAMAHEKDPSALATGPEPAGMTLAQRDELASKLVDWFSFYSGVAGLIPVPFVDIAVVGGTQFEMLRRLARIYGVPFSKNLGKSVLANLAGIAVPAATAATAASALKGIPLIGTGIGALTMSAGSAGATYLIGKVFIQHFASGGTLLDFRPPDHDEILRSHAEKIKPRVEKVAPDAGDQKR
jgi:uncharacterized protein (DUF697 family)